MKNILLLRKLHVLALDTLRKIRALDPKHHIRTLGLKHGGSIVVRPAKVADFDTITELFANDESLKVIDGKGEIGVFPKKWLRAYLNKNQFLVVEYENEVVGALLAETVVGPGSFVWMIAIKAEHRNKGIAYLLQLDHERRCRETGITAIVAYANNNENVRHFVKKYGFTLGVNCIEIKKNL